MSAAKKITAGNFKRYGWVIEYPHKTSAGKKKNLFRIILKERGKIGWRIAYLVVRDKAVTKLEQHPDSFESFEPIAGESLLYVSTGKTNTKIECFYLNKPVILKKGIWHGIVTLSRESEIKITENAKVKCVYSPRRSLDE
jgi:ureidoglycolate hydrolase